MNPDILAGDGREVGKGDVVVTAAAPPSLDVAPPTPGAAAACPLDADAHPDCLATRWTDPQEWPATRTPEARDPAWDAATLYAMGGRVAHGGAVFEASWSTCGQVPGEATHGPWQEIATSADGTAVWTRSRIFDPGDVVVRGGVTYVALWWTRDQQPGDPHGPWRARR